MVRVGAGRHGRALRPGCGGAVAVGRRRRLGDRMILARGSVVLVALDPTIGREHAGTRPAIVVSAPSIGGQQRFHMVGVIPVTTRLGLVQLYPVLSPGPT